MPSVPGLEEPEVPIPTVALAATAVSMFLSFLWNVDSSAVDVHYHRKESNLRIFHIMGPVSPYTRR